MHNLISIALLCYCVNHVQAGASQSTRLEAENKANQNGQSALHIAAYAGDFDTVEELLNKDADCNAQDDAGQTPLNMATKARTDKNIKIVKMLISNKCDVNIADVNGVTPLHNAAGHSSKLCVQALINAGANIEAEAKLEGKWNWTPMFYAFIPKGNHMSHKYLLDAGGNIHHRSGEKWTPLHMASAKKDAVMIKQYLKRGADPRAFTHSKTTPLHLASMNNDAFSVKLLIEALDVQDLFSLDDDNSTPLHLAAHFGQSEAVGLLIKAGADCSVSNISGNTALHEAVESANVETVKSLLSGGCDANVYSASGQLPIDMAKSGSLKEMIELFAAHESHHSAEL